MSTLVPGTLAPDWTLLAHDGAPFTLSAQRGRPVALYFYPQDDTAGCTTQNQEFAALAPAFAAHGAVLAGISPDPVASHARFRAKYHLGQTLLADPDHQAIDPYGVWQLKSLYGRQFMGLVRTSFLLDAEGRITQVLRATRVKGHAARLLALLQQQNP